MSPALEVASNIVSAFTALPMNADNVDWVSRGDGVFRNQRDTVWVPVLAPVINVAQLVGVHVGSAQ